MRARCCFAVAEPAGLPGLRKEGFEKQTRATTKPKPMSASPVLDRGFVGILKKEIQSANSFNPRKGYARTIALHFLRAGAINRHDGNLRQEKEQCHAIRATEVTAVESAS